MLWFAMIFMQQEILMEATMWMIVQINTIE